MDFDALREAKIIGHRGAAAYAPENTLAAIQKAHDLGASWVEFDVMLTRDGEAIIMHDQTVNRTTNGKGKVANLDFADIRKLDAGSWFGAEFAGEKVPTFVEYLELLNSLGMMMEVEIKPTKGMGRETAIKTLEILNEHWPMNEKPPLLSSGDPDAIALVQEIVPELVIGSVIHKVKELKSAAESVVVSVNHKLINDRFLKKLKERFDVILPYTVNDRERAEELLAMGVDAVFTDYPDLLV